MASPLILSCLPGECQSTALTTGVNPTSGIVVTTSTNNGWTMTGTTVNSNGEVGTSTWQTGVQTSATSAAVPNSLAGSGSSNSTAAQISLNSKKSSGVSSGAVAGIAIGAAVVGAALAFIAAIILFKKRNRKQSEKSRSAKYETYADSTPELAMVPKSIDAGRRDSSYVQVSQVPVSLAQVPSRKPIQQPTSSDPLAGIIPPVADERDVQSKVAALFGEMHKHIDAYYRDVHASITSSLEPELAQFGEKGVDMAGLLQNCSSPTTALKHALVGYILGITGPKNGDEGVTMFPKELNSVKTDKDVSDPGRNMASTLHRRLSVYLYNSSSSRHSQARQSWALSSDIREAAENFSLTFFPWANPTDNDQDRDEGLAQIISSALELRIWLFGQPSVYDFVWEGSGRRGLVISPALVRQPEGMVILEMSVVSV